MDAFNSEYDISTFNSILDKRYSEFIFNKKEENVPQAYVLGGQPGAGKTALQKIFANKLQNNLIVINGDEFRALHPNFEKLQDLYGKDSVNYTGEFSSKMTEALIEKIKESKLNILVEGTLRTAQVPINTCNNFKEKGYTVTLAIMAVKPKISYISTIMRYELMIIEGSIPRATPKENHDRVVNSLPENLKEIFQSKKFDNIVIYNREGTCLYDMYRDQLDTPDIIMKEMLFGQWSQNELNQFFDIGVLTQQFMEKRNAPELNNYKDTVFNANILNELIKNNDLEVTEKIRNFFSDFNFNYKFTTDKHDKKFMYKLISSDIFEQNKVKFSGICKYFNEGDKTILRYNPSDEEKISMTVDSVRHSKGAKR